MHDELSVLKLVAGRLEAAGLPYMVTGSVALSLYAEPRMTRDVDLVVDLRPSDTTRILELFGAEFNVDADRIRAAISCCPSSIGPATAGLKCNCAMCAD